MKTFTYKAKAGPGNAVKGELNAESLAAAEASLDAMGYVPIWIREGSEAARGGVLNRLGSGIKFRDVTVFTRQLASLTKSGVPILKALSTISNQADNRRFAAIVDDLEGVIRDGSMLSSALAKHPDLFSDLYVSMVRAGETGGVLDTILFRLADARESEEETRRKIQAAIAYPILIMVVGVVTVVVLLTFFLPRVLELFKDYKDLPVATRMLMSISGFFQHNWYWLFILLLLFGAVFKRLASMDKGRMFVDRIKLHMPLLKKFILHSDTARFARTMALLIDSGIPIDKALGLSARTLNNAVLRDEVETLGGETIRQGSTLSSGLRKAKYFPPLVANMTGVGEEAGSMDESLLEVADFYEKEIDMLSKTATSLIEPIMILVIGLLVGFIVAAMLLPIFELGTNM